MAEVNLQLAYDHFYLRECKEAIEVIKPFWDKAHNMNNKEAPSEIAS